MDLRTPPPTLDGPAVSGWSPPPAGSVADDIPSEAPASLPGPLGDTRQMPAEEKPEGQSRTGFRATRLRPRRPGHATAAGPPELATDGNTLARRRLRAAGLILFGMFAGFIVRHAILEEEGITALTAAGLPRFALTGVIAAVVAYLFSPAPAPRTALVACEAVVFGGSALFLLWVHRHGLLTAPPEMRRLIATAYPGAAAVPWVLLIEIYALFLSHAAGRAAAVIAVLAVAPLASAVFTARDSPELWFVLFDRGMFSAMGVWMTAAAAAAVYGAFRLSSLRRAAAAARDLGSYRLGEKLGGGGMGEVYAAEHRLLRRPCAVKVIRPDLAGDDHALARFDGEVRAAAALTHPNSIEIYDFGVTESGLFYCVMELLPGLTLHELVQRGGPLDPGRAVHLMAPVCGALAEAHGRGLIHRDVKPANVFATERGGVRDVAKLLDFGLVKKIGGPDLLPIAATGDDDGPGDVEDLALTRAGATVGSPLFAAPEAIGGTGPTARSDLYSAGATLFFLLTGRCPFEAETVPQILYAHRHTPPVPVNGLNPDVPADLATVVMRCLAKDPADRFASAAELAAALRACDCHGTWSEEDAEDWWAALDGTPSGAHPLVLGDADSPDETVAG